MGRSITTGERAKVWWGIYGALLLLLVLNDHCLKGRPDVSPLISGKLSDFCGLLLAPLTLVLVVGARHWLLRATCFAVPSAVFVAVKLSVSCARELEGLTHMTGMSWRIWSDPTDLIALVVLPLGFWLTAPGRLPEVRGRAFGYLTTAAGALACLASGVPPDPTFHAKAYLVNLESASVEVELAELRGDVDCSHVWTFPDRLLRHGDFVARERYQLEPKGVLPLEGCGPVRVTVGAVSAAIAWEPGLEDRALPPELGEQPSNSDQLVLLERREEVESLSFGAGTRHVVLSSDTDPLPVSNCAQANLPRLEYSNSERYGTHRLVSKKAIGSGCLLIELGAAEAVPQPSEGGAGGTGGTGGNGGEAGAAGSSDPGGAGGALGEEPPAPEQDLFSITWCLPESEFPFIEGDTVRLSANHMSRSTDSVSVEIEQTLLQGGSNPPRVTATEPDPECGYVRDACGAIWQPLQAVALGTLPLKAGERIYSPEQPRLSFFLVRALRTVLTGGCDAALQQRYYPYVEYVERWEGNP